MFWRELDEDILRAPSCQVPYSISDLKWSPHVEQRRHYLCTPCSHNMGSKEKRHVHICNHDYCAHTHMHTPHTHACTHAHTHMHAHTQHTHMHTHMHTHTKRTCKNLSEMFLMVTLLDTTPPVPVGPYKEWTSHHDANKTNLCTRLQTSLPSCHCLR